jgi:hypothetical protein
MGIICVLAILVSLLLEALHDKSWKHWRICLLRGGAFLLCFFAVVSVFDAAFIRAGYADSAISQSKIPYFKVVKGLGGASYPWEDGLRAEDEGYVEYNANQKAKLEELIRQPESYAYVLKKMIRFLGEADYQYENTFNHDSGIWFRYPLRSLYFLNWFQYALFVLLALFAAIRNPKKRMADVYQIFFCGYVVVYFFIEAFSSYRFEAYPVLLLFAGEGSAYPMANWPKKRKHTK